MPVKSRLAKARDKRLPAGGYFDLMIGTNPNDPIFATDEDRRAAWFRHRADLLAKSDPGTRPRAWWETEASEPRNYKVTECLQLHRMGELTGAEVDALMPEWRRWETKARTMPFYCAGPARFYEGRESYLRWRAWAGIPDEVIPPAKPLKEVFNIKD